MDEIMVWFALSLSCALFEPAPTVSGPPEPVRRLLEPVHQPPASLIVSSDDENRLAEAAADGSLRVWDVPTGLAVMHTEPSVEPVLDLTFSGPTVWSVVPGGVRSHDPVTNVTRTLHKPGNAWSSATFVGPDRVLGLVDGEPGLWHVEPDRLRPELAWSGPVSRVWPQQGERDDPVAAWFEETSSVGVVDAATGERGVSVEIPTEPRVVAWSPDGSQLLLVDGSPVARVWTLETSELIELVLPEAEPQLAGTIAENGFVATVVEGAGVSGVALWDPSASPPLVKRLQGTEHTAAIASLPGGGLAVARAGGGLDLLGILELGGLGRLGGSEARRAPIEAAGQAGEETLLTLEVAGRSWAIDVANGRSRYLGREARHRLDPEQDTLRLDPDGTVRFAHPGTGEERARLDALRGGPFLLTTADGRYQILGSEAPRPRWRGADGWSVEGHVAMLDALGPPTEGLLAALVTGEALPPADRTLEEAVARARRPERLGTRYTQAPSWILRDAPAGEVVGELPIQTKVEVLDVRAGSARVRAEDGQTGWGPLEHLGRDRLRFRDLKPWTNEVPVFETAAAFVDEVQREERPLLFTALANAHAARGDLEQARIAAAKVGWDREGIHLATTPGRDGPHPALHLPFAMMEWSPWLSMAPHPEVMRAMGLGAGEAVWLLPVEGPAYRGSLSEPRFEPLTCYGTGILHLAVEAPRDDFVLWTLGPPPASWSREAPVADVARAEAAVRRTEELPERADVSAVTVNEGVRIRFAWWVPAEVDEHGYYHGTLELRDYVVTSGRRARRMVIEFDDYVSFDDVPRLVAGRDIDGDGTLEVIVRTDCWLRIERADGTEVMTTITPCCGC